MALLLVNRIVTIVSRGRAILMLTLCGVAQGRSWLMCLVRLTSGSRRLLMIWGSCMLRVRAALVRRRS